MKVFTAMKVIRAHPERFLHQVPASPIELTEGLVGDTLRLGASRTITLREGELYGVGSDVSWFPDSADEVAACFDQMRPFPEAGANSFRAEVLVGAFASSISVWNGSRNLLSRGAGTPDANPFPEWVRQGVLFRL